MSRGCRRFRELYPQDPEFLDEEYLHTGIALPNTNMRSYFGSRRYLGLEPPVPSTLQPSHQNLQALRVLRTRGEALDLRAVQDESD